MQVHKVTLSILDFDIVGADEIKDIIENVKYPNHCIAPHVINIESCEIGEWRDHHPLNDPEKSAAEFNRLFDGEGAMNE